MQGEEVSPVRMVGTRRATYEPGCLEFPPRFPLQQQAFWLLTAAHGLVTRDSPEVALVGRSWRGDSKRDSY